ncbi:cytochrome b/b6 domain-containing protein [Pelagivirga sediminicola]|uniref:cytochrome b/b6 domain-containing protein n=1 Tax=Pelagivirga sediminicola TaxID=2170575 RepID=UPI001FAFF0FC|nr:cytochrome b/b6 domain-containing protein [Pelagivirga sediminicola]
MKSASIRYGTVAITLHGLSAALILALLGTGFRAASLTDVSARTALLQLHVPLDLAILALTLRRIGWRAFVDRRPAPLPNQSRSQQIAADGEARRVAADEGLVMVPPFRPELVRDVATYALELFTAAPDLDTVHVPIGCGSGISGTIIARDALRVKTRVVGVVCENGADRETVVRYRDSDAHRQRAHFRRWHGRARACGGCVRQRRRADRRGQ